MKKIFSTLLLFMLFTTLMLPLRAYGIDNDIPLNNSSRTLNLIHIP